MTTGEKLTKLRKDNNITQENLADLLGVSRQSVSKWESDLAYPETDKLIRLSEIYHCSVDYLIKDSPCDDCPKEATYGCNGTQRYNLFDFHFERKSKTMVGKLPLWHINIGLGRTAKGIFAIGNKAIGLFSFGLLSLGLISFGILSLGLIAFGVFGLGLIAVGSIAVGLIALGAVAFGLYSVGAVAVGDFSVGALAIGKYFAYGDEAYAQIAIGKTYAEGTYMAKSLKEADFVKVTEMLNENVPKIFALFKRMVENLFR